MTRIFVLSVVLMIIYSFEVMAQFTSEEKKLINSGDIEAPFRVLEVHDEDDLLFLRKKAQDINVPIEDEDLQLLIERMITTLDEKSGVGLAAPQVGISRNLFLFLRVDQPEWPIEIAINPRIVNYPSETICFERDGCLSVEGVVGNSIRYPWIDVEYTNGYGELVKERLEGYSREGNFVSIIFQHEFDHLQGVLFTDKLSE